MKAFHFNSDVEVSQDERRRKLLEAGADKMADALLELAARNTSADELVKRLVSGKSENLKRYYRKLEQLRQRKYFYEWKQRQVFIDGIEDMLMLLEDGASTPEEGVKGIIAVFEADGDICESCHDDGEIGIFFESDVCDLMVRFASGCEDKDWIADEVLRLCINDKYGCRDCLIKRASKYLPEGHLRRMIEEFEKLFSSGDNYKWHWKSHIKKLARQVKDKELLESAWCQSSSSGDLSEEGIMELAELCFEKNEIDKAVDWLKKLPSGTSLDYRRNELLEEIHRKTGNKEELSSLLLEKFKSRHDAESLQELLDVIGEDRRESIIEEELRTVSQAQIFDADDIRFLLEHGKTDESVKYIFSHAADIDGADYYPMDDMAKKLSALGQPLAASLLFRALLDSILKRGKTDAYHYGIEYLNQLDALAGQIENWNGFKTHKDYLSALMEKHGRKYSFWNQYEE